MVSGNTILSLLMKALSMPKLLVPALFFLVVFPPAGKSQDLPDNPVVEHLRSITVTVKTSSGSGSGCIIVRGDQSFVLTAAHVVDSLKTVTEDSEGKKRVSWQDCEVVQKVVQDGKIVQDQSYSAEVIRCAPPESGYDLALLRLYARKAFTKSTSFYTGKKIPPIATRLYHVGSPLGDIGTGSVIPGFYSAHGRKVEKQLLDQISCSAFPGSSGGAVTLEDGRHVGIVVRGQAGGFILITPIREILAWSQKAKISFLFDEKAKVPPDEELMKGR